MYSPVKWWAYKLTTPYTCCLASFIHTALMQLYCYNYAKYLQIVGNFEKLYVPCLCTLQVLKSCILSWHPYARLSTAPIYLACTMYICETMVVRRVHYTVCICETTCIATWCAGYVLYTDFMFFKVSHNLKVIRTNSELFLLWESSFN